ncbi:MAG TPA: aldo/keto reductase [Chloroflexota bacterium]|nr:aldo/keto reductase [Chloroflexota bacterium]
MEYRRFGRTGLRVSVMGLGSGGPSQLGQGSGVSEAEASGVVRRALELGINLIDTAADYRESEGILGRALRGVPRASYILCTKFNPLRQRREGPPAEGAIKAEGAMAESLERSLSRLQTDYVDLFQLHGVPPESYEEVRDRFVPQARRLQEQGKFRFLGLTETFAFDHQHETLARGLADDLYDAMMVGYNLLTPLPEEHVLPEAQRRDVGILVMCAVRRAIARPGQLEALIAELKARGELAPQALPERGPLDWLVHDGVPSVPAAAYKFAAGHPAVSCVLTGTTNREHLEENVAAILGVPLPEADRRRLVSLFGPIRRNLGN